MVTLLADESFTKVSPAALKQAGYQGVIFYVSRDAGKCGTRADVDAAHADGLGALFVFEDSAQRPLSGYAAGLADGQFTASYLGGLGLPAGLPAYAAVDFQVTPTQMTTIVAYLQGFVAGVKPYEGRGYGDTAVVDALVAAGIYNDWQTCAWSGSVVDGKAAIYQRLRPTTGLSGPFDEDVALVPLTVVGLWMPPSLSPTPAPAPAPAPVPAPAPAPAPTRRYQMLVFAQGLDTLAALAVCGSKRLGVATTDITEAKAAIARGDRVIVIGGPAASALGVTAPVGAPTALSATLTVAIGATAADTLALAVQIIK